MDNIGHNQDRGKPLSRQGKKNSRLFRATVPSLTGQYNPLTHVWVREPVDPKYATLDLAPVPGTRRCIPEYLGNYNSLTNSWRSPPASTKYLNVENNSESNVVTLPKKAPGVKPARMGVVDVTTHRW
eukprot:CAMPEP_0196581712 /NCGR_PEP_ID=MMETSP1081-20130531/35166_1 /TAXON_ID=36882 /ORGANISM="Pyramimonas amylifera, Strain CCMP720" /LENGTH=126 /DNA_ID=CAMNT_0041902039 /DNA_START=553 /DNA_END=930 /DNA_ORIENTATION=+